MPRILKIVFGVGGIVSLSVLLLFLYAFFYNQHYARRVYPGIFVGEISLDGLTKQEVINFVENVNNRLAKDGIRLTAIDRSGQPHDIHVPLVLAADSTGDVIRLDSERLALQAFATGRTGAWWQQLFEPVYRRFVTPAVVAAPVIIDEKNALELLHGSLSHFEDAPRNATVIFPSDGKEPTLVSEKVGWAFNYPLILEKITNQLSRVSFDSIVARVEHFAPTIVSADLRHFMEQAPPVREQLDIFLQYAGVFSAATSSINISRSVWLSWLEVKRDSDTGRLKLGFNLERVGAFLDQTLRPVVDESSEEARFIIKDHRVEEFVASHVGRHLNNASTTLALEQAFLTSFQSGGVTTTVMALIDEVQPHFSTADVNDFGITEVIGVGSSTFHDSHTNRIKNVAHAVARLNGILIKPGEEFSANRTAGPFTAENGFLPEMVIKGKEIKPEVGGGMCQIGTTLFRMAMNSGMPITERRNHSLVVGYYADPVNGNPGTDATLYEPLLDFKFINDTGNYLLLQTAIDYKKQMLTFTLWGKPDGRKGWYTHPLVSRWIPAGDPEQVIVNDGKLKPGEEKCQNAFRGAVASFTYTRITSSSEQIDQVFTSYYRPLPKICMVGADPRGSVSSTLSGEPSRALGTPFPSE